MKREILLFGLILVLSFVMFGCTGDEEIDKDTIPPTKPVLVPHLGDTGDGTISYNNDDIFLDDTNNGIDADSGNSGFKLLWEPLIFDNDLEKIIIHRYMNDDIDNIVRVDSITAENNTYIDNSISADFLHENKFSFFIDVYDRAGNSTRSDTVHYRLSEKVYPTSPFNGQVLASSSNLVFDWNDSVNYDFYRILLFSNQDGLIWFKDILIDAPDENLQDDSSANYTGGNLSEGDYYWRVDVFKFDYELDDYYYGDIDDNRTFYYGSESEISSFSINRD